MPDLNDTSRRQFLGFTGKAGISTRVAHSIGMNLDMVNCSAIAMARSIPMEA
jgi:hypothetical protein